MLLHADNFDYYGTDTSLVDDGIYASTYGISLVDDPDGISTPKVLLMAFTGDERAIRWVLPSSQGTVGVGGRFYLASVPASNADIPSIIQFRDGSNTRIANVQVTPTGSIRVINPVGTSLGETPGPVVTAAAWYHIEAKWIGGVSSDGSIEVRVEGISVLTIENITFSTDVCAQVACGCSSGSSGQTNTYLKDLVVWDGSGTQNNDFLGSVLVYDLATTADVSFNWTSTGANGYSVLANNPPEDGVEYISADDSPPAASTFEFEDLPANIISVKGLITRVRAAKSDGGDGTLQVSLTSNGSDDAGADRAITVAQTYWSDVSELDPDTASAWTPSGVNDAILKIDRTT
jgi:hypothetical protein